MKKSVYGRKFSRDRGSRIALFRSLAIALVDSGSIVTTEAKAKAVVGWIDKLVKRAKREDVHSRRILIAQLSKSTTVDKLIKVIAPLLSDRTSGYTRIIRLGPRKGDGARMASLEFVKDIPKGPIQKRISKHEDTKDIESTNEVKRGRKKEEKKGK